MNSSKNILNQRNQDEKKAATPSVPEKKAGKKGAMAGRNMKPIVLMVFCVIVVLVLCVGVAIQQLKPKVVVTIGDTKLTMDDMMYPIFEVESTYLAYDEMYQMYMGTSVWDATYQGTASSVSGATNSVGLKQEIMNNEVQYEILYQKAVEAGYELTEEEKTSARENAELALKDLTWSQKLKLNFTENKLTKLFEKRTLADRFREDEQEELNKDVDEAAAIADISKEDYRQYDVEYYYASTSKTDDDGNSAELTADEKKELKKKFRDIAKRAKAGEDFSKLIEEDEEDISFDDDTNFTEQGGFPYASADNLKKIKKMKNDTVSDAYLDDETGYYLVIKMLDNNSSEAYDTACDQAVQTAQDEAYQTWYESEQENYKIEINTDIWSDVTIGYVTTDIVTIEDLQRIAEENAASSDGDAGSNE